MMKWIDVNSSVKPPENRVLLCYCPEWSETCYQVARWSEETGFYYYEEPNDRFSALVESWAIFLEAD